MTLVAGASRRGLAVLACFICAAMAHYALSAGASGLIWAVVLALPVIACVLWLAASARSRALWLSVPFVAVVMIYLLERSAGLGFVAAYGLPHAAAYLLLLWYFGRSLRSGREALITRLARQVRGTLSPERERYTRRLTIAWCVFFAAQITLSVALLALAPLDTWSFFVNVLNAPLIAAMFLADLGYRFVRFRGERVASVSRMWRAFIEDAAGSTGAKSR